MRVAPGIGFLGQDGGGDYSGVDFTSYDPAGSYPGPYDPSASAGTGADPSSYFQIDPYAYDPTAGQPAGPFPSDPLSGAAQDPYFPIDPYAYGASNPSASSASSPSPMVPTSPATNKPHSTPGPSHGSDGGGGGGGNPLDALKSLFGKSASRTAQAIQSAPPVNTVFGLSAGYFVLLGGAAVALYLFTRKRGR